MLMNSVVHELSMGTMNSFWQPYMCCINTDQVLVFFNIYLFCFIHSADDILWIVSTSVIIHKIFETSSKASAAGSVQSLFLRRFLLVLTKFSFREED